MREALYFTKIITFVINVFIKSLESPSEPEWHMYDCPTLSTHSRKYASKQSHVPVASAVFKPMSKEVIIPCTLTGSLLAWHPRVCAHCSSLPLPALTSLHPTATERIKTHNLLYVSPSVWQKRSNLFPAPNPPLPETVLSILLSIWLWGQVLHKHRLSFCLVAGIFSYPSLVGFLMLSCLVMAS